MHHGNHVVLPERLQHRFGVADVVLDNGAPFDEVRMSGREIIQANRNKACFRQRLATMRPNETGAARHQDRRLICHLSCSLLFRRPQATGRRPKPTLKVRRHVFSIGSWQNEDFLPENAAYWPERRVELRREHTLRVSGAEKSSNPPIIDCRWLPAHASGTRPSRAAGVSLRVFAYPRAF